MDMSGMDMGTGSFQHTNIKLAKAYWYAIAAFVAALLVAQIVGALQARHRLRSCRTQSVQFPTKPTNAVQQSWATATAVAREMSYPQLYVPVKGLSWLTPPPLGHVLILLAYWSLIVGLMVNGAIVKDAYFWERIGFRNAWITITQLPLLYMLASKSNIIAWLTGSSYERLNWLHRWVARTMFVTACMHGWHFWTEWVRADFVELELEMMPMVKYGLGAWGILLWMVITSIVPLRRLAYEFFVVQHIAGAIVFLYVTYVHIPAVARPYFWWAVAALCFDRAVRIGVLLWQNIRFTTNRSLCRGMQRVGHQAQVQAVGDSITVVTIKDVHFSWRAGQHVYLWMPKVGPIEAHPFTIASAHQVTDERCCNSIQLVIRAHAGFSKRVHNYAVQQEESARDGKVTVLVSGPYGAPPRWGMFETLVLISASTGASFTLPILESVLQEKQTVCTKRIDFVLTARRDGDIDFYMQRLYEGAEKAKKTGIELRIHVCVTGGGSTPRGNSPETPGCYDRKLLEVIEGSTTGCDSIMVNRISAEGDKDKRGASIDMEKTAAMPTSTRLTLLQAASREPGLQRSTCRPDIEAIIREPVEAAGGETSVIVCGGRSLTSTVRNCVSRLSDERAVHKGTGAQGIHLHVEEYSF